MYFIEINKLKFLHIRDFEYRNNLTSNFSGMSLTMITCLVLFCKCRSLQRKGRKRNLASDADGDYLVNGMYL